MEFPENSLSNASHHYAYRVPSPPRIFVPPPIQTSIDPIDGSVDQPFLQPRTVWPNSSFLSAVEFNVPKIREYVVDWTYNERQTAQEVLPFLYLGSLAAARDKAFLQSKQITMVLGIRRTMNSFMMNPKAPRDLGLEIQFVDTSTESQQIHSFFEAISKVNDHMERRYHGESDQINPSSSSSLGRVLVFCESGNERSAAAVVAYGIAMFGLDVVSAIQLVQGQRFSVNIDDAARNRLRTFSELVDAQIGVLMANGGIQGHGNPERSGGDTLQVPRPMLEKKRSIDRMMMDDDDNNDCDAMAFDEDGKSRRDGSAPFSDANHDDD